MYVYGTDEEVRLMELPECCVVVSNIKYSFNDTGQLNSKVRYNSI